MQLSSVWSRIICKRRIAGGINFLDSKDGYARGISHEREGEVLARDEDRARQRRQLVQPPRARSRRRGGRRAPRAVTFFVSGHIQERLWTPSGTWDISRTWRSLAQSIGFEFASLTSFGVASRALSICSPETVSGTDDRFDVLVGVFPYLFPQRPQVRIHDWCEHQQNRRPWCRLGLGYLPFTCGLPRPSWFAPPRQQYRRPGNGGTNVPGLPTNVPDETPTSDYFCGSFHTLF